MLKSRPDLQLTARYSVGEKILDQNSAQSLNDAQGCSFLLTSRRRELLQDDRIGIFQDRLAKGWMKETSQWIRDESQANSEEKRISPSRTSFVCSE